MSLANRLVHSLAIVTPTVVDPDDPAELDEYGHANPGEPIVDYVAGMIQPKSQRELALANQGGAVISTHTVFLMRRTVSTAAFIRYEPDNGDRYEVTGVRDYNFGASPHLELDVLRISSPVIPQEGS